VIVTGWCGLLGPGLGSELGPRAAPGAVQALAQADRRLPKHRGGLRGREPVTGHERERVAVTLVQARERAQNASGAHLGHSGIATRSIVEIQPLKR
jgi:hypothetical protein